MYTFYYDVLKPRYGDKVRLAYTDTDSFVLYIETDDVYKDFRELGDVFDFSGYTVDHNKFDRKNKKRNSDSSNMKLMAVSFKSL